MEEAGISCKTVYDEAYINNIQKIEVSFEDDEKIKQLGPESVVLWEDCHKTAIYTNKESYVKILENAIPSSNRWWGGNSIYDSEGYIITVYTPNPYDLSDYYVDEIYYRTGEIPQFLKDDLEKIPFGEEQIIR